MKEQPSTFQVYLYSMIVIVGLLWVGLVLLIVEQGRYQATVEKRDKSLRLVEELQQSSADLAKLVRTYIISENPVYKEQFFSIIDIRDGESPRPKNYNNAYADQKIAELEGDSTQEYLEPRPLLELLGEVGLTAQELHNLYQAKQNSDLLVAVEKKAMELVDDNVSNDLATRREAFLLLADDYFVRVKANIMGTIADTKQMIFDRTQQEVDKANQRLNWVTGGLLALGGALVFLMFKLGKQVSNTIGCSIPELQRTIQELGSGKFVSPIKHYDDSANNVIGWLARTQQQLADLNLEHFRAIVGSSDDAIISKDLNGIIASWNRGAETVFGYTAEEIIGKPMTTIIPKERLHEEPEILAKIAQGEKVDHFETQRLRKDGRLVDVSVTISPMYDPDGKVIGASKIARDITSAKAAKAEIHRLAYFDNLTGLANRAYLDEALPKAIQRVAKKESCLAVLFVDLDNFKPLNDQHGHSAGDLLLQQFATRLNNSIDHNDIAARFGGDEFIVVMERPFDHEHLSFEWLTHELEGLVSYLSEPYQLHEIQHQSSVSIGVMTCVDGNARANDLILQADQAMYKAKAAGKNGYAFLSRRIYRNG